MVCDTENPNLSGKSSKRRLRIVDLPAPEGPLITMGLLASIADVSTGTEVGGAIIDELVERC